MCGQNDYIDSLDPGGALGRADAPPFFPHPRRLAGRVGGGEEQGREQYETKNVEEGHPRTRGKEKSDWGLGDGPQHIVILLCEGRWLDPAQKNAWRVCIDTPKETVEGQGV